MNEIKEFDSSTAERGQEVTQEVYYDFLNVMPPISLRGGQGWYGGFQMGEPARHRMDTRSGKFRPLFMTFTCRDNRYFYQGENFAGEVDSRPYIKEVVNNDWSCYN